VALILDTNAVSAIADGEASALELLGQAERAAVSVIVLGEYRIGIRQSRHRASYETWLREWVPALAVLDVDDETTQFYAEIALELRKVGRPIPTNDLWIAAQCRQHSMPLLSRDRHFDLVSGLRRLDW
jgi:tRNA(fMet)-specific endonuclease VapC